MNSPHPPSQRDLVRASLVCMDSRDARREVYKIADKHRCTHCGFPGGHLMCDRCENGRLVA